MGLEGINKSWNPSKPENIPDGRIHKSHDKDKENVENGYEYNRAYILAIAMLATVSNR